MQSKERHVHPRLLTAKDAALYCGVSVSTFRNRCPIRPVALGPGCKLQRFDRQSLDDWIDQLGSGHINEKDWLAELDRSNDHTQD